MFFDGRIILTKTEQLKKTRLTIYHYFLNHRLTVVESVSHQSALLDSLLLKLYNEGEVLQ